MTGWTSPILAAALDQVESLYPFLVRAMELRCQACGRDLHPGHTAYTVTATGGRRFLVCYECGEAMAAHLGFIEDNAAPWSCPFGGGPPLPR